MNLLAGLYTGTVFSPAKQALVGMAFQVESNWTWHHPGNFHEQGYLHLQLLVEAVTVFFMHWGEIWKYSLHHNQKAA